MSRRLSDLHPSLQRQVEALQVQADREGLDLLIYCTLRSFEEQARLYRRGRSLAEIKSRARTLRVDYNRRDLADCLMGVGPQYESDIVTHAGPGQSLHNYGYAFDAVPMRDGKPVWGTMTPDDRALWDLYGEVARRVGLDWAGRWERFREFPHCQMHGYRWQDLIRVA